MSNLNSHPFTIPNLFTGQFVDKNGMLTDSAQLFLSNLISQLQSILTPEGIFIPKQSAENIVILNTAESIGSLIFNSDTNKAQVNLTGTFKDITTS